MRSRVGIVGVLSVLAVSLQACGDDDASPADAGVEAGHFDAVAASDAEADAEPGDAQVDASQIPVVPDATECALEPETDATARLVIDGRRLRDTRGREVLLRGINAGGRSKFTPFIPFSYDGDPDFHAKLGVYMDLLASWGINVLRMPFSWEGVEPTRGTIDEAYLDRYEAMIDAAWARGMRVIVDFHQDVYATPFCGDGFPLWTLGPIEHGPPRRDCADGEWFFRYTETGGPVQRAFDRLWSNADGILDDFEAMWRVMARRFGAHAGVLGFEVINEPGWGTMSVFDFETMVLPGIFDRMGNAIREESPGAMIFGGGPGTDALMASTSLTNPTIDGFVYAPHYYDLSINTSGRYPGEGVARRGVERLAQVGVSWNRPVLFGEFGAPNHVPDQRRFLRELYAGLDATLSHATIWETSFSSEDWNHEDFGVTNPDGTERPVVDTVVRAYPRAVHGRVSSFSWDELARTLVLEVEEASDGVSEVFVPTRHVGANPRIGLRGGCVSWRGADGRLLLRRDPGETRLTLVVQSR